MRRTRSWTSMGLSIALALVGGAARGDGGPSPAEEHAAFRLADPALVIELVAAEPEVSAPVAMAWDERGRLFVAEMRDYPAAPGGGRIKRLEDRDGDGRYEHAAILSEGLPFPNGILPWKGGILVTAAPDLIHLVDVDDDGKADRREVVLTGFGEGNQQLRVNSPIWGIDNRITLANGRSGGNIRRPGAPASSGLAIPRNDLRVEPGAWKVERLAGFSQFGLPRDDWGDRFPSWNTVPLRHVVLENVGEAEGSGAVADILDLADGGRIFSLAPTQRRFNAETVAFFNASCGPIIYRGDVLGGAYRGHAFVCEPLTSVVHHRRLDPDGATYVARRVPNEVGREFLASSHPWFRPVNLATGPDGALYVADFCRAWVEHPAFVPEKLRSSVDFREGFEYGRIWRIRPRATTLPKNRVPLPRTVEALSAQLESPNGWTRDTAQRLLVERGDASAAGPLVALAHTAKLPQTRVQALWTLEGIGRLDPAMIRDALDDSDPRVREHAVRLAGRGSRTEALLDDLLDTGNDPDARVRLRLAEVLGQVDTDHSLEALARLAARDADSRWMSQALLTTTLGTRSSRLLAALAKHAPDVFAHPTPSRAALVERLAEDVGRRIEPERAAEVTRLLARARGAASQAGAEGLLRGLAANKQPRERVVAELSEILAEARSVARGGSSSPAWARVHALRLLVEARASECAEIVSLGLDDSNPPEARLAATQALARLDDPQLAARVLEGWQDLGLSTRRAVLGALSGSPRLAESLLDAIAGNRLDASEIDPGTRESLRRHTDARLRARLEQVFRAGPESDRRVVVSRYEAMLGASGDATKGRALFERHCQTCHTRGASGSKVGPDLLSVAGKAPGDLAVSILDPNREVAPDGVAVVVALVNGGTLTGLLASESPAGIVLRRAEGILESIPRGEVEAMRSTGRSLMPEGFEQSLSPADLDDLITYLKGPLEQPPAGARP